MRTSYYHISEEKKAVVVEDGIILEIMDDTQYQATTDSYWEAYDINGMSLHPGIVNFHLSLLSLSDDLLGMNLQGANRCEAVVQIIQAALKKERQCYVFHGLRKALGESVNKFFLDSICNTAGLIVIDEDAVWHLNSFALQQMDLDSITLIDEGNVDTESGEISGAAIDMCVKNMQKLELSEIKERILQSIAVCNSLGVTQIFVDDLGYPFAQQNDILTAYQQLAYQRKLNARIHMDIRYSNAKGLASFLDEGITTQSTEGLYEIGSILIDPMHEEAELMYQMGNSFNMSKRIIVENDDAFDLAMDLFADCMLEDNLLLDGVLAMVPLSAEQKERLSKKNLVLIEQAAGRKQMQDGYYGFSIDQNAGEIFRFFYGNDIRKEAKKQPWMETVPTGKIVEGYGADFFVSEKRADSFSIHLTIVDGKLVFEK